MAGFFLTRRWMLIGILVGCQGSGSAVRLTLSLKGHVTASVTSGVTSGFTFISAAACRRRLTILQSAVLSEGGDKILIYK